MIFTCLNYKPIYVLIIKQDLYIGFVHYVNAFI